MELARKQPRNANAAYKQTELGLTPSDWEVSRLRDLTVRIGDGIHTTPNYISNSNYFFINGNNLKNGKIEINEKTLCVSKEEYHSHNKG